MILTTILKINYLAGVRWRTTRKRSVGAVLVSTVAGAFLCPATSGAQTASTATTADVEKIVVVGRAMTAQTLERNEPAAIDIVDLESLRVRATSMSQVLRQTLGITVRQSGGLGSDSRLTLNGLTGRQVPIFVDGVPLELTGLPRDPVAVPTGLVRRLEVLKGVVPIEYGGDALGGAINLVTYDGRASRAFAGYELASFGTHRFVGDTAVNFDEIGLQLSAQGFFDRTDNDYAIDVELTDELGRTRPAEVDRFHDGYLNYGGSVGARLHGFTWASDLQVRAFVSRLERDIQNGLVLNPLRPFGDVTSTQDAAGVTVRYLLLGLADRIDIDLAFNFTERNIRLLDVGTRLFDWTGEVIGTLPVPGEFVALGGGGGLDQVLDERFYWGRLNVDIELAEGHHAALSVSPAVRRRQTRQTLIRQDEVTDIERSPATISSVTAGLAYRSQWFDRVLENDAFGKLYAYRSAADEVRAGFSVGSVTQDYIRFGAGDALIVRLTEWLAIRSSYEFTARVPGATELLGDGALVSSNPNLREERSHNVNASVEVTRWTTPLGDLNLRLWGFWREVQNLIFLEAGEGLSRFSNVDAVRIFGLEGEVALKTLYDVVMLSANVTWEEARNTSLSGAFERFADDRIPNRPYLYGSAQASLTFGERFFSELNIQLFGSVRYVEEFFVGWESAGDPTTKETVDRQWVGDVGTTFAYDDGDEWTVALTTEVQNVADATVFDFFGVPRPGRSFHFKLSAAYQ